MDSWPSGLVLAREAWEAWEAGTPLASTISLVRAREHRSHQHPATSETNFGFSKFDWGNQEIQTLKWVTLGSYTPPFKNWFDP